VPSTTNRGYIYPSEYSDDWYNTFVALVEAIDTDVAAIQPGSLTESIKVKTSTPYLRLKGTENSAGDLRMVEDAGDFKFQKNTGTENSPTWSTLVTIKNDGTVVFGVSRVFKEDTYANLKSTQDPTTIDLCWATDLKQLVLYTKDASLGDDGWIPVA
jgi:hypothetical protein